MGNLGFEHFLKADRKDPADMTWTEKKGKWYPVRSCLCGLYLLLFTLWDIKTENLLKYSGMNSLNLP